MRILTSVLAAAALLVVTVPGGAQSLAEVAKKEQDRRKDAKVNPRVYTNNDLKAVPPPPPRPEAPQPVAPPDSQAAPPPSPPAPDAAPSAAATGDKADTVTKDRAYWAKRMQEARDRLDRDRTLAEALQTRVNALTADFVNRDDPAQRGRIELERQKALSELDRMKKSADADALAIVALEEEARRAGVPPGWLR